MRLTAPRLSLRGPLFRFGRAPPGPSFGHPSLKTERGLGPGPVPALRPGCFPPSAPSGSLPSRNTAAPRSAAVARSRRARAAAMAWSTIGKP